MEFIYKNRLKLFLFFHVSVWSVLPLMRRCLPMDTLEALIWGGYFEFGTNKHPPLSGFIAFPFYKLLFESAFSMYLLSQLCILTGFIYLYKLAKRFVDKQSAVCAVLLMEGIVYYNVLSVEYNVNILSLAFWPMTAYYFYRAVTANKMRHWVLLGLVAGLNLLTKYTGGVLLACIGAYLILTPEGRAQMKRVGAYVTFFVCLAVIAPHVWWLYTYDFFPFEYIVERGTGETAGFLITHVFYPIKFLGAQVVAASAALLVYGTLYLRSGTVCKADAAQKRFLIFTGVFPVLLMASVSAVCGMHMKSMWGTPTLYLAGLLLVVFFPLRLTKNVQKSLFSAAFGLMAFFALSFVSSNIVKARERVLLDGGKFTRDMTDIWYETYDAPLKYVGGNVWYASLMSLYAPDRPVAVADDLKTNPWLDSTDILKSGAMILVPHAQYCKKFAPQSDTVTKAVPYTLDFENGFGKSKSVTFFYCFLPPETVETQGSVNEKK